MAWTRVTVERVAFVSVHCHFVYVALAIREILLFYRVFMCVQYRYCFGLLIRWCIEARKQLKMPHARRHAAGHSRI